MAATEDVFSASGTSGLCERDGISASEPSSSDLGMCGSEAAEEEAVMGIDAGPE
jgi:hypothetical protein